MKHEVHHTCEVCREDFVVDFKAPEVDRGRCAGCRLNALAKRVAADRSALLKEIDGLRDDLVKGRYR